MCCCREGKEIAGPYVTEWEAFLAHTYASEVNTDIARICEIRNRTLGQLRVVNNDCSLRGPRLRLLLLFERSGCGVLNQRRTTHSKSVWDGFCHQMPRRQQQSSVRAKPCRKVRSQDKA